MPVLITVHAGQGGRRMLRRGNPVFRVVTKLAIGLTEGEVIRLDFVLDEIIHIQFTVLILEQLFAEFDSSFQQTHIHENTIRSRTLLN